VTDTPPERSPDLEDPDWVDKILARARDRAARPEPASVAPVSAAAPRATDTEGTSSASSVRAKPPLPGDPGVAATTFVTASTDDPRPPANADPEPADDTDEKESSWRGWIEWGAVAVGAIVVALLIRAFVLQAFYIPSESMEPTLHKNDRIMVNKLSYRLHDVRRGDLVVFRRPPNMSSGEINDLIKRVIALPNETIELRGSDIYIDDQKLTEPYLVEGTQTLNLGWVTGCTNPSSERTKCTIPPGHLFVMGDNRSHSSDGRVFGPIDEDLIVGRAFVRIWPLSKLGFL
jgi:signal peptidase I